LTKGFEDKKVKCTIDNEELNKVVKRYKNVKKYMKSPLFVVKTMDGTEDYVSKLIEEGETQP
jgi:hypothetical protein